MMIERFRFFSLGLFATALLAGCDGDPPEGAQCYDAAGVNQECYRVHTCYSSAAIQLCDGTNLANLPEGYFRKTCHMDQGDAIDFCVAECEKAATQNGYTLEAAQTMCQDSSAGVLDDDGYDVECWDNKEQMNAPGDYSHAKICPGTGAGDLPFIYCHGTEEPDNPAGEDDVDFDENRISYWKETIENGTAEYTAGSIPPDTGCGYTVVTIPYEWLTPEETCKQYCKDQIAWQAGSGDQSIPFDNCESFVPGSLCYGPPAPSAPSTVALTLSAWIGGAGAQGTFSGFLTYSTYACGEATCPILINSLSLQLDQAVSGVLSSSTGSTAFAATSLAVSLERTISGSYSSQTGTISLRAGSLPMHVTGVIVDGAGGSSQSVDMVTYNPEAITGTLQSGSVEVSGAFVLMPGVSISFGTPPPQ